jgi:hypothetical protein
VKAGLFWNGEATADILVATVGILSRASGKD